MGSSQPVDLGLGDPARLLFVTTILAMLFVILRFVSRHVTRAGRASDDYVILYPLVSYQILVLLTINIAFVTLWAQKGLDREVAIYI